MKMAMLIVLAAFGFGHVLCDIEPPSNSSNAKDMYVVHATVYQVGILTNKTDEELGKAQGVWPDNSMIWRRQRSQYYPRQQMS